MRIFVLSVLALALAPGAIAGCCLADPSALDVRPTSEPFRVTRDRTSDEIILTWEDSGTDDYRIFAGDLRLLHATGRLDDEETGVTTVPTWREARPARDVYLLVSARCESLKCSRGRDSAGREREVPGCATVEGDWFGYSESTCLLARGAFGVVRTDTEYADFANCFEWRDPPPPRPGSAIVYALDSASSACGTCLEFTCVEVSAEAVTLWYTGSPWGDCDALHAGGPWAYVPDVPSIGFSPIDPTSPSPGWVCH